MNKRWQVSEDGVNFTRDVVPQNAGKLRITESRDLDNAQVFFRKKLSSPIIFWKDDFTYFKGFERRASGRCQTLYVRLQLQCGAAWQTFWTGEFSTGSGKWNYAECFFEVKPETVDRYTCLLKKQGVNVNTLNTEVVNTNIVALPPGFEIAYGYTGPGLPISQGWVTVDSQALTIPAQGICGDINLNLSIYWRETAITQCVDGIPVMPAGTGWVQEYTSFCSPSGFMKWVRPTAIPWPFPNDPLVVGPSATPGNPVLPPESPECATWHRISISACPGGFGTGIFICLNSADSQYTLPSGRRVKDVADFILSETGCDLQGIRSDFFEWNPPGTAPGYVAGTNYVTGEVNQVDQLILLQKSDAIDPDASNPATIGNMTFKEFMAMLNTMFQVYWDIDRDGYLRIEHWKYWTFGEGDNLVDFDKVNEPLIYDHLSSNIPSIERLTFAESRGADFVGKDIVYSGPCVSEEGSDSQKTYSPGKITTDIGYVVADPTAIAKDGFVLLATTFNGTDYDAIIGTGALSGSVATNTPLSTANLMRDYWTWNRYLSYANMNDADVTFDGFRTNVEQDPVRLAMCCKVLRFNPNKTIGTTLGTDILGGLRASMESAEYDLPLNRVELKLRYAY